MADGILYCLNLNLSVQFRVGSRRPVTFKTELYVTPNFFATISYILDVALNMNRILYHDQQKL